MVPDTSERPDVASPPTSGAAASINNHESLDGKQSKTATKPMSSHSVEPEVGDSFELLDDVDIAEARRQAERPQDETSTIQQGSSHVFGSKNRSNSNSSHQALPLSREPSPASSYASLGVRSMGGRVSPGGMDSRSPSPRPGQHLRKGSITKALTGAFSPRERSQSQNHSLPPVTTEPVKDKSTSLAPPIANKPSWLKRTASAGKVIITGSSSRDVSPIHSPVEGLPPLPPRQHSSSSSIPKDRGKKSKSLAVPPPLPQRPSSAASASIPVESIDKKNHDTSRKVVKEKRLNQAASFEDTMLPPPPTRSSMLELDGNGVRNHHSMDVARSSAQFSGSRSSTSQNDRLATGFKSGIGAVHRRIGAWSQETGTGQNAIGYLQAGGGAIGSAVSSGWSAFRSNRNSTIPTSSSSGLSANLDRKTASAYFPATSSTSNNALEMNGMDGPSLDAQIIKRAAPIAGVKGEVFGRELAEAAEQWPIADLGADTEESDGRRRKRSKSLPAVAIRCVDHLRVWVPQEEGIFRVSGRSSHIALLRRHFDAGADVDLEPCDPGDIDPHAVASLYKSYLRELPTPILTSLFDEFDVVMKKYHGSSAQDKVYMPTASVDGASGQASLLSLGKRDRDLTAEQAAKRQSLLDQMKIDMSALLQKLPDENWWLLGDLARLLSWTASHSSVNKMTLQNLLMVFCPSLNLSPPFLRYLAENNASLFRHPDIRMTQSNSFGPRNCPQTIITPSSPMTSPSKHDGSPLHTATHSPRGHSSITSSPSTQSAHKSQPRISKITIPEAFAAPSSSDHSDTPRFSTPIADRFARTGPVDIILRDKPAQ